MQQLMDRSSSYRSTNGEAVTDTDTDRHAPIPQYNLHREHTQLEHSQLVKNNIKEHDQLPKWNDAAPQQTPPLSLQLSACKCVLSNYLVLVDIF